MHLTIGLIFILIAMNLLGQGAHLMFVTIPKSRKIAIAANKQFSFAEWWHSDNNLIIGVQLITIAGLLGANEWLQFKPELFDKIRWLFWLWGVLGSAVGMNWSKYEATVMNILDKKANVSDNVIGPASTVEEVINKGSSALNVDVTKPPEK